MSTDDLNLYAAHAQKAGQDTFCKTSIAISKASLDVFQPQVATCTSSVDKAGLDSVMSLQGDVVYC